MWSRRPQAIFRTDQISIAFQCWLYYLLDLDETWLTRGVFCELGGYFLPFFSREETTYKIVQVTTVMSDETFQVTQGHLEDSYMIFISDSYMTWVDAIWHSQMVTKPYLSTTLHSTFCIAFQASTPDRSIAQTRTYSVQATVQLCWLQWAEAACDLQ